ncbi:copper resistance protein CopC [Kribbella sp. CA-247076]|uniref:copper resistance CopC/CopD family protein n=1 Tax=Kribbella sp. CA-247076 TaxID=3239941 RepID=UPI003D8A3E13
MFGLLRRARWLRVTVPAGILLAVAWLGLTAVPAAAHAILLGTDPKNDAVLPTAPAAITLTFNEQVGVWPTSVSVFAPDGERLSTDVRSVDTKVVAQLPSGLERGTYTITWRVTSADDHPVSGGFVFSIGERSAATAAPVGDEPSTALNAARVVTTSLGYLGVLAAVGLAVFELGMLAATPGGMPVLRRRLRTAARIAVVAGVVGVVASVPVSVAWQLDAKLTDSTVWSDSITSDHALAAVFACVGSALTLVRPRAGTRRRDLTRWYVGVGSVLALASFPLTGHTRTYGPAWLVVAADVLHVIAGAVWAGGIIGLAITLSKGSDASPERAAVTAARFSAVAAWTMLTLAAAGTILAWRVLGSIRGLWETSYGLALLAKLAVVAAIVALAAWNRFRLLPRVKAEPRTSSARRTLRLTVSAEALAVAGVLALTSILVTQPPREQEQTATAPQRVRGVEAKLGENLARLRISPVTTGQNSIQLYLRTSEGEPLEPLAPPTVRFSLSSESIGPVAVPLTSVGPGQYEGRVGLPRAGDWTVQIAARTSKYESPTAEVTVRIG